MLAEAHAVPVVEGRRTTTGDCHRLDRRDFVAQGFPPHLPPLATFLPFHCADGTGLVLARQSARVVLAVNLVAEVAERACDRTRIDSQSPLAIIREVSFALRGQPTVGFCRH